MAKLGSKVRPYQYDAYYLMYNYGGGIWTGGWVRLKETSEVVYITSRQGYERDNTAGILGSEENPFSNEAYAEMFSKMTWPGGFVRIVYGEEPEYIDGNDREDSACGSGSGTGCGGRYLMSGQEWVTDITVNLYEESQDEQETETEQELLICWGEGSFESSGSPYVSAGIISNGGPSQDITPLSASWEEPFVVRIQGSRLTDTITYNIPSRYRR